MEFLRKVDFDRLAATSERVSQTLIGRDSGASSCSVNCIKTPPGEGSPAGLHKHTVDQLFYILSGTMSLEIEGKRYEAGPGTLVVFPAGIPHRNWNGGSEVTVHLAINSPLPDPPYPLRSRSTELRSEFAGRDPRELGRRPAPIRYFAAGMLVTRR
jgi:mannose-6-phosphate isomerase-like protein (cupin superfamily)